MRTQAPFAVILLLAALSTPARGGAQPILGRVVDDATNASISTVAIMLLDSTDTAVAWAESDSLGTFRLRAPGTGPFRIYADRLAYGRVLSEPFSLQDLGSVELVVRMVPQPMELDPLVVTAERRRTRLTEQGFYRRRQSSMGYFFDAEALAEGRLTYVTDVMRTVPGVSVRRSRTGGAVALTQRFGTLCPMKVILDGFKLDQSFGSLDDLVDPNRVIGVEVYPGGVGAPVQHRGTDSRCGIVMVWTR